MKKPKLLFVSGEVYPFAKSGGLADVAHSLPRELSYEYDIKVVMPLYQSIDRKKFSVKTTNRVFTLKIDNKKYEVEIFSCVYEKINYLFVYSKLLCDRKHLYGTAEHGYKDNALRFAIFNHAVVELLKFDNYQIAHLNDWQSALTALFIKQNPLLKTKTIFTIHNLAYQGVFEKDCLKSIGVDESYFTIDAIEFYGKINFMKAGIAYAHTVTTVSPTYAKEILTPEFGAGLNGFLRYHKNKLIGIINGIDTEHFSPSKDKMISKPYTDLKGKIENKEAFLKKIGFKSSSKPLFIFIGRFTWQKGMDILIESLPKIASMDCNIAILGEGEKVYHDRLKEITVKNKNIYLHFGYDEALSHQMYAASDFLIMPSLFEPCGLNQLISMHYGTMPIVHHVGGLVDTVYNEKKFDPKKEVGYGIIFHKPTKNSLIYAINRALKIYKEKKDYQTVIEHDMRCDFSWNKRALAYIKCYKELLK